MKKSLLFLLRAVLGIVLGINLTFSAKADITVGFRHGAFVQMFSQIHIDGSSNPDANFVIYEGGINEVRDQIQLRTIEVDIVSVLPHEAQIGCATGLFEKLPRELFVPAPDGTSMDDDTIVSLPSDCAVPQFFWSYLPFYSKNSFQRKGRISPKTIADFFDVEKFPGNRALNSFPHGNLEMALLADGVAVTDVYKLLDTGAGLDRAFVKLDTIKKHILYGSSSKDTLDMVLRGEAAMGVGDNGSITAATVFDGAPFTPIWDGQVLQELWLTIVKGSQNYEDALRFLIAVSTPRHLAERARGTGYAPMRRSAVSMIESGEYLVKSEVNLLDSMPSRDDMLARTTISDPDWWKRNGARVSKRFTAWMNRESKD